MVDATPDLSPHFSAASVPPNSKKFDVIVCARVSSGPRVTSQSAQSRRRHAVLQRGARPGGRAKDSLRVDSGYAAHAVANVRVLREARNPPTDF